MLLMKRYAHVACGCRPQVALCGYAKLAARGIEIGDQVAKEVTRWCTECWSLWESQGCLVCDCQPGSLCRICTAALKAATYRPSKGLFKAAMSAAKTLLAGGLLLNFRRGK